MGSNADGEQRFQTLLFLREKIGKRSSAIIARAEPSRMYDAVNDPYTYENSTVLINKLGLRSQAELDAFEHVLANAIG